VAYGQLLVERRSWAADLDPPHQKMGVAPPVVCGRDSAANRFLV